MAGGYSDFEIVSDFDLPAHASLPEIPAWLCFAMAGKLHDTRQTGQWQAGIRISDLTVLRILLFDQVRIYFDVTLRYPLKSLYNIAYCIIILFR